jgi:hypothetical protein
MTCAYVALVLQMTCAYVALDLLNQICYINFNDFGKAVCSCQSGVGI